MRQKAHFRSANLCHTYGPRSGMYTCDEKQKARKGNVPEGALLQCPSVSAGHSAPDGRCTCLYKCTPTWQC